MGGVKEGVAPPLLRPRIAIQLENAWGLNHTPVQRAGQHFPTEQPSSAYIKNNFGNDFSSRRHC